MFGDRYFGPRYFADRYFGRNAGGVGPPVGGISANQAMVRRKRLWGPYIILFFLLLA